jgi:hypothetical protein
MHLVPDEPVYKTHTFTAQVILTQYQRIILSLLHIYVSLLKNSAARQERIEGLTTKKT